MHNDLKIAFFGGEPLSVPTLEILKKNGLVPTLIVCSPDRKSGRKMQLKAPPIKEFAQRNNIPVFQPENLKNELKLQPLTKYDWDLFVVVAYNHILPMWLTNKPKYKTINLHPSLLPKLRGPSPIRSAILENRKEAVGVSVILLDEKTDHGPILGSVALDLRDIGWPIPGRELDEKLAALGGEVLYRTICEWIDGKILPISQDESRATYTKKFTKDMGELTIDPFKLPSGALALDYYHKICAFDGNPGTYFIYNGKRVKIHKAHVENSQLFIDEVTKEGANAMPFEKYLVTV
jgi:methionyl-tRNA formyltransferase